ncbi:MAG: hypothetical protein M3Q07_16960 [Pseudobdellovibrionaceae bacterium]|nr:hypothetical protein [Pseudobdellovibrionaceae bacterium]
MIFRKVLDLASGSAASIGPSQTGLPSLSQLQEININANDTDSPIFISIRNPPIMRSRRLCRWIPGKRPVYSPLVLIGVTDPTRSSFLELIGLIEGINTGHA